jgi:hypothetical protein
MFACTVGATPCTDLEEVMRLATGRRSTDAPGSVELGVKRAQAGVEHSRTERWLHGYALSLGWRSRHSPRQRAVSNGAGGSGHAPRVKRIAR